MESEHGDLPIHLPGTSESLQPLRLLAPSTKEWLTFLHYMTTVGSSVKVGV